MAGRVTVLFFMIVLIQCLRIERSNGLETHETSKLLAPSTNLTQGLFADISKKDTNATIEEKDENKVFPTPSFALPEMVKKAKDFARQYLSSSDLKRLRVLVQKNRENGTETEEIRHIVVGFLNNVLNKTAKHEINQKREQLQRDFGNDAILRQ